MCNQGLKWSILVFALAGMTLVLGGSSCGEDEAEDNAQTTECVYSEYNACGYICDNDGYEYPCLDAHDWGFQIITGCNAACQDVIGGFRDSDDACDQAVAACLDSLYQNGPVPLGPGTTETSCQDLNPTSCDDAWNDWNDCLALTGSDEC